MFNKFSTDEEELDQEQKEKEKEDNELYIKLFHPLTKKQEEEIWEIWENSICEDIYIREKEVEKYCSENNCDFLTAICEIYDIIRDLFLCSFFRRDGKLMLKYLSLSRPGFEILESFLERRFVGYLNDGKPITEKQKETLNKIIDYIIDERYISQFDKSAELLKYLEPLKIFTFKFIQYEETTLKELIQTLSFERQKIKDKYINEKLKIKLRKEIVDNFILYNAHTKDMYYPVSKIETENNSIVDNDKNTNIVEVNNEIEVLFVSQYNSKK